MTIDPKQAQQKFRPFGRAVALTVPIVRLPPVSHIPYKGKPTTVAPPTLVI